jgi:iron complex transport system substrate-binding protein
MILRKVMKKTIYAMFALILVTGLLAGCGTPTPATAPAATNVPETTTVEPVVTTEAPPTEVPVISVTDALGRTVEFEELPSRIAIVGKAAFMLLDAAFLFPEAVERITGYELRAQTGLDFINTAFPRSRTMTVLNTDATAEQIAPLNPDLVMMKSYLKDGLGAQIEEIGIKVVYLDLETPEAMANDIRTLGQVFGDSERAEQLVNLYDQAVKKITDVTSTLSDDQKPSVLMLQYSDKGGEIAFKVPPAEWIQTGIVEMAGGKPVWTDTPTDGWTVITLEQIAAWNPDVILVVDYKGKALEAITSLKQDNKWALLDAVKNGKIYAFPLDFQSWDQADTRWILGLTWTAKKLHPDLFSNISMAEEIRYFYSGFYNLSDSEINQTILSLVRGDL